MCNTYIGLEIRKAHTRHDPARGGLVPAESPYNASRQRQTDQPALPGYRTRHEVGMERLDCLRMAHRSVEGIEVFVALLRPSLDDANASVIKIGRSCIASYKQTMIRHGRVWLMAHFLNCNHIVGNESLEACHRQLAPVRLHEMNETNIFHIPVERTDHLVDIADRFRILGS